MKKLVIFMAPFAFFGGLKMIQPKHIELRKIEPIKVTDDFAQQFGDHYRPIWEANKKLVDRVAKQKFFTSELQCLIDNVYNEAAFEPEEGMLAVAIVTINRVHNPDYPKTVCGVVYERHLNPKNHKMTCQFSWTCKPKRRIVHTQYLEAREAARQAFLKHVRVSELEGVTLYHASYINTPDWATRSQYVTKIGQHIFYKEGEL